ncbi:unnamed protein product [Eruca vesicaria subsp. sativa]|uniref:Uncharacterized protein n=1 Tax=Eruca vesicaria subsp. sativa TaxID=29727 RepID=A0ABC8LQY9_ERUVS|nr:unnamed protein product [Eruca vesicaria subsp. sativa]
MLINILYGTALTSRFGDRPPYNVSIYLLLADKEHIEVNRWNERSEDLLKGLDWHDFVSLQNLRRLYLDKEGSLKVEIEFEVVPTTKYSS